MRNRENLTEERRDHLNILVHMRRVLDQGAVFAGTAEGRLLLGKASAYLQEATLDGAKFAAMATAAADSDS